MQIWKGRENVQQAVDYRILENCFQWACGPALNLTGKLDSKNFGFSSDQLRALYTVPGER